MARDTTLPLHALTYVIRPHADLTSEQKGARATPERLLGVDNAGVMLKVRAERRFGPFLTGVLYGPSLALISASFLLPPSDQRRAPALALQQRRQGSTVPSTSG
jgi:hypothetical protein